MSAVAEIAANEQHTCLLKQDGELWCWGENSFGQLGDGTMTTTPRPSAVRVLQGNITDVAVGGRHTCGRRNDSSLWCWGQNASGQRGVGPSGPSGMPLELTSLGATVVEVSAGGAHTCARKQSGALWCWGFNAYGQVGNGITGMSLSPEWVMSLGSGVAQVVTGLDHTCARKSDSSLWCWGRNHLGQLGLELSQPQVQSPTPLASLGMSVVQVALGANHSCAVKADHTLWCWGDSQFGQLGRGSLGTRELSPVYVTRLGATVVEVSAGKDHTCARTLDGSLWCWGNNDLGQLGIGAPSPPRAYPEQVAALGFNVVQVSAGHSYTCARKADDTVWCWGANNYGQLGDGTMMSNPMPQPLPCR